MSSARTDAPDPDEREDSPNRPTYIRSTDLMRTQGQVGALLGIMDKASDLLYSEVEVGTTFEVDPESQIQARNTYALAAVQLRNLIDDQARWTLSERELDQLSGKILKESLREARDQRRYLAEQQRPSSRLQPKIRLFEVGWVAWFGEDLPTPSSLHGIGKSPEDALEAFDRAFHTRRVVQPVPTPPPVASPETPKKRKKKTCPPAKNLT